MGARETHHLPAIMGFFCVSLMNRPVLAPARCSSLGADIELSTAQADQNEVGVGLNAASGLRSHSLRGGAESVCRVSSLNQLE